VKLKLLLLAIEVKPDEGGDSKVRRILETISLIFKLLFCIFYSDKIVVFSHQIGKSGTNSSAAGGLF
jgi:hypothetical protein